MTQLLGLTDLKKRWGIDGGDYTPKGIAYMRKREDFPKPFMIVNEGRTELWKLTDILMFEVDRPWLRNVKQKRARVARYAWSKLHRKEG